MCPAGLLRNFRKQGLADDDKLQKLYGRFSSKPNLDGKDAQAHVGAMGKLRGGAAAEYEMERDIGGDGEGEEFFNDSFFHRFLQVPDSCCRTPGRRVMTGVCEFPSLQATNSHGLTSHVTACVVAHITRLAPDIATSAAADVGRHLVERMIKLKVLARTLGVSLFAPYWPSLLEWERRAVRDMKNGESKEKARAALDEKEVHLVATRVSTP